MDPQRRSWPQTRIALLHPSPHSRRHTREAHPPSPHSRLALHPPAPTRERATASAPNPRARTSHDSAWLQGRARGACGVRVCAGPAAASSNTRQRQPGRGDAECAYAATTTHGERRSSAQSPDGCNPRALHAGVARLLPRVSLASEDDGRGGAMEALRGWRGNLSSHAIPPSQGYQEDWPAAPRVDPLGARHVRGPPSNHTCFHPPIPSVHTTETLCALCIAVVRCMWAGGCRPK